MPDLLTIAVQSVIGVVPLGAAWFAYRASTDANKRTALTEERQAVLERSKVDSEAFERARDLYDSGISLLERQLARVQSEFDQLSADSAAERAGLQRRIRLMQTQIEALEATVIQLRRQLIDAGIAPATRPAEPGQP